MSDAVIVQRKPFAVDVEAGNEYWWCSCGRSQKQPLCDGSHKETTFRPVQYNATETRTVSFCGCKHTSDQPVCDGSHGKL